MATELASTWTRTDNIPYTQETWTREDAFHESFLIPKDDALSFAVSNTIANGLPDISVSPAFGKFLYLVAMSIGAKRILEVGTLGGYSAMWQARALPVDGEVVCLELLDKHAKVARENLVRAGPEIAGRVKIIVGCARESITQLKPEPAPFDLVFLDADKDGLLTYYREAKRLVRSGGVILIDCMVRRGEVSDLSYTDSNNTKVRELLQVIKDDKEVEATTIGMAGVRGYDGFTYVVRK
ncbi:hypothetical protein V5O48_011849 [Marasmius crinis-equi]|uniref:O-methyltransferase n=1 Tax=Marasmius crinis-equi TaxID=585013 RepID=A0ABR3F4H4_9AGAR